VSKLFGQSRNKRKADLATINSRVVRQYDTMVPILKLKKPTAPKPIVIKKKKARLSTATSQSLKELHHNVTEKQTLLTQTSLSASDFTASFARPVSCTNGQA
jgi:hypothetical protein